MTSRRALLAGFLLALLLALGFAGNAIRTALRVSEQPVQVEPWMTPGLVAHTYGLDPEALAAALGVVPGSAKGMTIEEIANARGLAVDDLVAAVQLAIEAARP